MLFVECVTRRAAWGTVFGAATAQFVVSDDLRSESPLSCRSLDAMGGGRALRFAVVLRP